MEFQWIYECANLDDLFNLEDQTKEMLAMSDTEYKSQYFINKGKYILTIDVTICDRSSNIGDCGNDLPKA